jgi:hypothetical protein
METTTDAVVSLHWPADGRLATLVKHRPLRSATLFHRDKPVTDPQQAEACMSALLPDAGGWSVDPNPDEWLIAAADPDHPGEDGYWDVELSSALLDNLPTRSGDFLRLVVGDTTMEIEE